MRAQGAWMLRGCCMEGCLAVLFFWSRQMTGALIAFLGCVLAVGCKGFAGGANATPASAPKSLLNTPQPKILSPLSIVPSLHRRGIEATVVVYVQDQEGQWLQCTGVVIAKSRSSAQILTSHMCMEDRFYDMDTHNYSLGIRVRSQDCSSSVFVAFQGIKKAAGGGQLLTCVSGSIRSGYPLNFAAFTVSGKVPAQVRPLTLSPHTITQTTHAFMVHYSPSLISYELGYANPLLQGADLGSTYLSSSCQVYAPYVYDFYSYVIPGSAYYHDCQSFPGSHGAAVISQQSHEIIMIHGGDYHDIGLKHGVRSTQILDFLRRQQDRREWFEKGRQ